ncbi:MAG TPA: carboxypeptidase-like regulatory domain-containing protein [Stenomitos sp.]
MRRWILAMAMGLVTAGCADEPPDPVFRAGPPDWPPVVTAKATASAGVLSGEVYMATEETVDVHTGAPIGYALLPDGDAEVVVRQHGTRNSWQAPIASGSYSLAGLPVGVALDVTANKFGYQPRTRSVTLAARGPTRLSFGYFGGPDDSFLLPQPGYQGH